MQKTLSPLPLIKTKGLPCRWHGFTADWEYFMAECLIFQHIYRGRTPASETPTRPNTHKRKLFIQMVLRCTYNRKLTGRFEIKVYSLNSNCSNLRDHFFKAVSNNRTVHFAYLFGIIEEISLNLKKCLHLLDVRFLEFLQRERFQDCFSQCEGYWVDPGCIMHVLDRRKAHNTIVHFSFVPRGKIRFFCYGKSCP